jgi:hypothetical protein
VSNRKARAAWVTQKQRERECGVVRCGGGGGGARVVVGFTTKTQTIKRI